MSRSRSANYRNPEVQIASVIKIAMMPLRKLATFSEPTASLSNWPFWLGLALHGTAFLLYAAALARLPLNVVHL